MFKQDGWDIIFSYVKNAGIININSNICFFNNATDNTQWTYNK